jgi:transposase InsO family protein
VTTRRDKESRPAPDLVDRNFTADRPNQLWIADITYIPTAIGFLYLAGVLDVWSRKVVGWATANHLRRPKDVIHHSDQGSQLGFKRSSQHLCALISATRQRLRQAFSTQASCAAGC